MYHSCCAGEPAVSGCVVRIERLATALSSHDLSLYTKTHFVLMLREDRPSRFSNQTFST
jgi:hypothetical protein